LLSPYYHNDGQGKLGGFVVRLALQRWGDNSGQDGRDRENTVDDVSMGGRNVERGEMQR
jgi:hypothetical protein